MKVLVSVAVFGLVWLATSFLVSTVGDLAVGGKEFLDLSRNIYFAALEAPVSTAAYAILLSLFGLGRLLRMSGKPVSGWLFPFVCSGVVLGIAEACLLHPFAVYAWSGHDYETKQAIGQTRFDIGVLFETASGPVGCITGTAAAWFVQKSRRLRLTSAAV
jgi:hypothetical protein